MNTHHLLGLLGAGLLTGVLCTAAAGQAGASATSSATSPATSASQPAVSVETLAKENSPKGAVYKMFSAIKTGDAKKVKDCFVASSDQEKQALDVFVGQLTSQIRMAKAMSAKFPDSREGMAQNPSEQIDREAQRTEQLEVVGEGDTAKLYAPRPAGMPASGPAAEPQVMLKKVNGQWKIDAATFARRMQNFSPKMLKAQEERLKAIDGLTADVEAGKFKSVEEVHKAMSERMEAAQKLMREAFEEQMKTASQPSSHPAASQP